MKKVWIFFLFLVPLAVVSQEESTQTFEEFHATWEHPYTRELKFYPYALAYWSTGIYQGKASHFPQKLVDSLSYEFFFIPRILQGGSRMEVRIDFDQSEQADAFFHACTQQTEGGITFESFSEYQDSYYCFPDRFGFDPGYQIPEHISVFLFHHPWCVSNQSERTLGGFGSGILLDQNDNLVICWAIDGRH